MTDLENAWTTGYGLDGGGYAFEEPKEGFWKDKPILLWDDPDLDYIIGSDILCPDDDADLLVVAPNSGHFPSYEFPKTYTEDDQKYRMVVKGHLNTTDRECNCNGKFVEWAGAAGEPTDPEDNALVMKWLSDVEVPDIDDLVDSDVRKHIILDVDGEAHALNTKVFWKHSGNSMDKPYPGCNRCEGDGFLDSPGGEFAIYEYLWEDED